MTNDEDATARRLLDDIHTRLTDYSIRELYATIGVAYVARHLLTDNPAIIQELEEALTTLLAEVETRVDLELDPFPDVLDPDDPRRT
jgi:hypothetical protein